MVKIGLTNTIYSDKKEHFICPCCGKDMRHSMQIEQNSSIDFQSKDLPNRMNVWKIGNQIIINDGLLEFTTKSNALWTGVIMCNACNEGIDVDIIIEEGIITKIENFRKMERF